MHILINALGIDNRSGTGRYVQGLLEGFHHLGRSDLRLSVPIPDDFHVPPHWETGTRFEFHPVRCPSALSRILWEQQTLPLLASRLHVDALHSPAFIAPIRLSRHIPSIVTVHDLAFLRFPETIPRTRRIYYNLTIPASIRAAACVITDTSTVAQEIASHWGTIPSRTIHLGVDSRSFHPDPMPDDRHILDHYAIRTPYFLFTGTQEPRKNLGVLIRAMNHARECGLKESLVLAGRYGWMEEAVLRDLPFVKRIGFVPDAHLPALYRNCKAYCAPSLYEGFDLPTVEAVACGAPVLVSDIATHREVLGEQAEPVNPHDVSAWTEALLRKARAKPATGPQRTWTDVARDTLNGYSSLLESG